MTKQKILVWLSWWVDSAVSAHLLIQHWYDVTAGFMINYKEPENPECTTRIDYYAAKEVAEFLGIELLKFDFSKEYEERIIDYIYEGYKSGITPNPDVFCNNLIKFDLFLEEALKLWFDKIAMWHYAQIKKNKWINTLYRGKDPLKDQSYFLSRLNQHQLDHALLPLWWYLKSEVRALAHEIWLPNADRPDSQWLCFIWDIPMSEFLKRKLPEQEGDIIDTEWNIVWKHTGARFYTLWQRHQLYLPFKAYVTKIDVTNNIITVGDKYDPNLLSHEVETQNRVRTWDKQKDTHVDNCLLKIRYRQKDPKQASRISLEQQEAKFSLSEAVRWVTPGQILVAYTDDQQVLWSGIIT